MSYQKQAFPCRGIRACGNSEHYAACSDYPLKLATIESAFLLASLRRLDRSPDMPPLTPIRSLAYFFPVIQEILANPIPDDYLKYLRRKVALLQIS